MEEESRRRNHGVRIKKEESWRKKGGGIIKEESWRRYHERGITAEEP